MPSKIKDILQSDFKLILMLYSDNFIAHLWCKFVILSS